MNKFLLPSLNKAINAYLDLDPESNQRIRQLQGKAITIEFLPLHFTFQCAFNENRMQLHANEKLETDTTIRGTPIQMLSMMITKDNRHRFFAEDIIIEGNAEFGQQVIELFDHMHIDWEEYLSHFIGDIPAYQTGRLLKNVSSWFDDAKNSFTENINEYIHEEARWLPAREALQDFFIEIDTLRMDTDRMEARIKNLQLQMEDEVTP
jgi:ubiquinone biosynthesis protein UbiJ